MIGNFDKEAERGFEGEPDPDEEIPELEETSISCYVLPFRKFSDIRRHAIVADSKGWGLAYSEDSAKNEIYLTGDMPLPWWLEPHLIRTDLVKIPHPGR